MSCFGRNYKALFPTAAATSPGLFKEWVSAETPGRLPLGPVVLLGQLSGRPLGLVCVCMHLCFRGRPIKGQCRQAGFNIFSSLSKWRFYCPNAGQHSYGQGAGFCQCLKCWLFTSYSRVFNFAGEHYLGGLFKGSVLLKNPRFVWHLVLILLVYISSLPNFGSNISCYFFPGLFLSLIFLYLKCSFHYTPSLPHRKSRLLWTSLVHPAFHCFSRLELMHSASEEGPCYITAPLWFSVYFEECRSSPPPWCGEVDGSKYPQPSLFFFF